MPVFLFFGDIFEGDVEMDAPKGLEHYSISNYEKASL